MSAQLRRQIGAIRKQLAAVKNYEDDSHLNISDFLEANTDDSILDFMEILHAHRETFLTKLNKLENLNETWSKLMAENNYEVKIFHDYIEKYGDYRSGLNDAIKILEQIDTYDALQIHRGLRTMARRNLRAYDQCSFTESEHCSNDRKMGVFYQIELFDNILIPVPELHVRTVEFLYKDDYYCFDH